MKRGKFISYLVFLIIFSCTPKVYLMLSWQNTPVTVDGNMTEWPNPLRFYDYKSKINYAITNDRDKIYICLKISDEVTQFRVMEGGMVFSFDTCDSKTFPISVIYPQGNDKLVSDDSKERKRKIETLDIMKSKQMFLGLTKDLEVQGFKYPISGNILTNNSYGISAAINFDKSGIMVYEAVIPFSTFFKDAIVPADTNRIFSFKIRINELHNFEDGIKAKGTQDNTGNIISRGDVNVSNNAINSNIHGTGPVGYGNNTTQNTGTVTNPIYEPLEFKMKVKLSYF